MKLKEKWEWKQMKLNFFSFVWWNVFNEAQRRWAGAVGVGFFLWGLWGGHRPMLRKEKKRAPTSPTTILLLFFSKTKQTIQPFSLCLFLLLCWIVSFLSYFVCFFSLSWRRVNEKRLKVEWGGVSWEINHNQQPVNLIHSWINWRGSKQHSTQPKTKDKSFLFCFRCVWAAEVK